MKQDIILDVFWWAFFDIALAGETDALPYYYQMGVEV